MRWTLFTGLMLTTLSLSEMARFTTDIAAWDVARTGLTQRLGLGFIFVPLSTVTFSSLAPRYRNEGTSLFSLARNIGGSIGISLVMTYLAQRTQINHAAFADFLSPFSLSLRQAVQAGAIDLSTPQGLSML